jgi:hypothetical protein
VSCPCCRCCSRSSRRRNIGILCRSTNRNARTAASPGGAAGRGAPRAAGGRDRAAASCNLAAGSWNLTDTSGCRTAASESEFDDTSAGLASTGRNSLNAAGGQRNGPPIPLAHYQDLSLYLLASFPPGISRRTPRQARSTSITPLQSWCSGSRHSYLLRVMAIQRLLGRCSLRQARPSQSSC